MFIMMDDNMNETNILCPICGRSLYCKEELSSIMDDKIFYYCIENNQHIFWSNPQYNKRYILHSNTKSYYYG